MELAVLESEDEINAGCLGGLETIDRSTECCRYALVRMNSDEKVNDAALDFVISLQ